MAKKLHFREDGTFKIVQFTDIHWGEKGEEADLQSRRLMELVLDAEKPDLVVYTGDTVYGKVCEDAVSAYRQAVAAVEERGLAWAAVFGNHDDEGGTLAVTSKQLMEVQERSEYGVGEAGPDEVHGVGNYVVELASRSDERVKAALYFLDSGAYAPEIGGYDWVKSSQIAWYNKQSAAYKALNGGNPLPSLAFFHIPLPEYAEVWEKETCYGSKYENVCSSKVNSGLFAAMLENGDVTGTFVGHDHVNDFWGELHGIRLCYGRAGGYSTYGREGFPRGARVIKLTAGERGFESWLRLENGAVEAQDEHAPEERV
ncbi:metallophosphoesterase family protein [Paenibacillus sp. MBLB4367]|uniref:metallophosphoesterase family protein n=1 Tax=Paenibacillus sp. MBLB4367 TaxID=3384767 RepID=UPI0039082C02